MKIQVDPFKLFALTTDVVIQQELLRAILAELEADPNDGGQSRLSDELVERIKKVLEK